MKPIFIFSLPRSGSTLLQRMLATSEGISTVSEPWLLLPFVYTLKSAGARSQYGHRLAVRAIHDFYQQLPNGRQDYLQELHEFAIRLYRKNSRRGSIYFLDKTPRYHLIVNEILEIFPEGKFIFLWRNPLAVVASVVNSWCKGKWKPMVWHTDLYQGLPNLIEAADNNTGKIHSLRYEDLVAEPAAEMAKICAYLSIEYEDRMVDSFQNVNLTGQYGDKTGVRKYDAVSDGSSQKWLRTFNNSYRRAWAMNYLNWLGEDKLNCLGYSFADLTELMSKAKSNDVYGLMIDLARAAFFPPVYFLSQLTKDNPEHSGRRLNKLLWL